MNTLQGMAQSLLQTKSLLTDEQAEDWAGAMADAMIVDAMKQAEDIGADPRKFVKFMLEMVSERASEWLSLVR